MDIFTYNTITFHPFMTFTSFFAHHRVHTSCSILKKCIMSFSQEAAASRAGHGEHEEKEALRKLQEAQKEKEAIAKEHERLNKLFPGKFEDPNHKKENSELARMPPPPRLKVCVCVCVYVYICAWVWTCVCVCMCMCVWTCVDVRAVCVCVVLGCVCLGWSWGWG